MFYRQAVWCIFHWGRTDSTTTGFRIFIWRGDIVLFIFSFTTCVHLWEHSWLAAVNCYTASNKSTERSSTTNSAQNQAQSRKQEVKRRKKGQARKSWWLGGMGNERWHASHLNAKAEGIDSVSSPVWKPWWGPCLNRRTVAIPGPSFSHSCSAGRALRLL